MSSNKLYFVGGIFFGTIVGGVLGLLLAPASGDETRKKIVEGTEETLGNVYDQAMEYSENLKEQFQDIQEQMTERIGQYKNQIESKIQEIQDEVGLDIEILGEEFEDVKKETEAQAAAKKSEINPGGSSI